MKFYLLISLIIFIIYSQIAADWRKCPLVMFTESAAVSSVICELISHAADTTSGQQFTGTWQGAAVQTFALCTFIAKISLSETYPNIPSMQESMIYGGLVCGPLLKTTGCQLWQQITRNVTYFNNLADIQLDSLLARHRLR